MATAAAMAPRRSPPDNHSKNFVRKFLSKVTRRITSFPKGKKTAATRTDAALDSQLHAEHSHDLASDPRPVVDWELGNPHRPCQCCGDLTGICDLAKVACEHHYCGGCLSEMFERATTDASSYPPRCCGRGIPAVANRALLSEDLIRRFHAKALEFSTPRRTYCHRAACAAFVPPFEIRDGVAPCGACGARTCASCKGPAHGGGCPLDRSIQTVLDLAKEEGWQRCPGCAAMVELDEGCYHMICSCRSQFCYLCGTPWKQCECERGDQHHFEEL